MNNKYKAVCIVVFIILMYKTIQHISFDHVIYNSFIKDKVKVTVYYESLCPDSKFFIIYQLLPTFKELQDFITLDLVPYGKAQTIPAEDSHTFQCQHGEVECFGNRIHSCVVYHVKNPLLQLQYIACMIANNHKPEEIAKQCAEEYSVDFEPIITCSKGIIGEVLLLRNGQRTDPAVQFIPTIELNGSLNVVPQAQILKNLKKSVCELLLEKPRVCFFS